MSSAEKSLNLLRHLPRLSLKNLSRLPTAERKKTKKDFPSMKGNNMGSKKNKGRMRWTALGFEGGQSAIQTTSPKEKSYNYGYQEWEQEVLSALQAWYSISQSVREIDLVGAVRQYPPLTLKRLQLLIDTGRVNPEEPIDLASLCNTKVFNLHPENFRHFGVNLTDEGLDCFQAKVNIEVQWACEQSIAAVERLGGTITCAYFDIFCIKALSDPKSHFSKGLPIPKRLTPPADLIEFYTDPTKRGYLADPKEIARERLVTAQKYGYQLPEIDEDYLKIVKDPRQVFFGLEPGWVVNLRDKVIWKPVDKELDEYHNNF